jgi:fumarate hydratase, class II
MATMQGQKMGDSVQMRDAVVEIRRTHMQDATPLTLGQEWSGYAAMLDDCLDPIENALRRKRVWWYDNRHSTAR